ncbi:hypothetical protein HPB49_018764 [Dermacentor silvarum]|uniref:Uncharacterized protein n=1 Tax=Dermacentor silvarum TaxID=543639 RepID=A0ACB8CZ90_DERSI|nr:hypothetical protein HPB49_018764 [Dermacentor silvarum]
MATVTGVKRPQQPANDLESKVMILKDVNAGVSRQEIMKKYDVKRSTLSDYVKNQAKIFEAFDSGKFTGKRKRLRTAAHPKLEDALLRWITDMRNSQLPLSGPLICQQAERYALRMNIESFKATPEDTREPTGNVDDEVTDTRFDSVLPSGVHILDYFAINHHVAVAGPLTDDDILSEVLEEDQNHCSDDDGQDEPPTRRRSTVQEAAEALAVLEEFCVCSRDSERAYHHLMGLNKIVLCEIPTARQTKITHFFKK